MIEIEWAKECAEVDGNKRLCCLHNLVMWQVHNIQYRLIRFWERWGESEYILCALLEACIRQRAVQSLHSGEKRERASWMKRGMSLILLICRIDILFPCSFEYIYEWWRGNSYDRRLPTIDSAFQCAKVGLPSTLLPPYM